MTKNDGLDHADVFSVLRALRLKNKSAYDVVLEEVLLQEGLIAPPDERQEGRLSRADP